MLTGEFVSVSVCVYVCSGRATRIRREKKEPNKPHMKDGISVNIYNRMVITTSVCVRERERACILEHGNRVDELTQKGASNEQCLYFIYISCIWLNIDRYY